MTVDSDDNFPVGLRVLAVDDNPICLKLLETLLMKCHYHVTTTSQARMALKMLRENKDRFDLVISDVHMPDMDGFRLLELVGLEMDLPVIMLSANSDPKQVMKGITHGACDYLVKPVRIEELRNIWQHVIRKKKVEPRYENTSADQTQASGDSNGSPTNQNSRFNRKRKDEEDVSEENGNESEDTSTQKKPRVVWSIELHRKFVAAVNQLGIDKAVPKRILDLMNVEGLTRENVASHLQKYRLYLKRISSVAAQHVNMASLGVKDSPFIRMAPFSGFCDFQSGRGGNMHGECEEVSHFLGNNKTSCLSPYTSGVQKLSQMHQVLPTANQNPTLFQGIPSSLELDQLQQKNLDDSIMPNIKFTNPVSAIGVSSNPLLQHRVYHQTQTFDVGATLLSHRTTETSRISQENSFVAVPYLQNTPVDISPLEHSRGRHCQEGFVGVLPQSFEQDAGLFNDKMGMFVNGSSTGGVANNSFILEQQPKMQSGFAARNYDPLDAMMNAMIKREPDDIIPNCDFGFDEFSFGQGI